MSYLIKVCFRINLAISTRKTLLYPIKNVPKNGGKDKKDFESIPKKTFFTYDATENKKAFKPLKNSLYAFLITELEIT